MIGHKWQPAEGTIVTSRGERMEVPGRHGMHWVMVHDIDVRTQAGDQGSARVLDPDNNRLSPGTVVRLEVNDRTGEIRLHPQRDKRIVSTPLPSSLAPSAPALGVTMTGPGGVDFAQMFGGAQVVIGGTDASEILRTVMSGDPADRAAAKDRLRELAQSHGAGPASASDRLALLAQMLERGQLSQAEFDAKRQQILDQL